MNIRKLIASMTLEEKVSLCSGKDFWRTKEIERLGIPSIMVTDGPHGLRKQAKNTDHLGIFESIPATCFPSAAGLASTWNRDLLTKVGSALGLECQAEDISILLGPGVNIKRSPLCGRNFEYFSEDPYLSSEMAISHIKGVQAEGVGTSLKHFAANNQENRRMTTNVVVDERTLREIYLASFESVVKKAKPWTVMSSYNKLNGEFASESSYLLQEVLRNDWGFEGFVVSDWGGVNERADGLAAGLDLEMPSNHGAGAKKIINAIQNGILSEQKLDEAVERLLNIIFKAVDDKKEGASFNKEEHHQLAREVARESMVLLKNKDHILPLKKEGTIAVMGEFAQKPRFQGGGSSHVNPTKTEDIYEEIYKIAPHANVLYSQGYKLESDVIDESLIDEAKKTALLADVAILIVGIPDRYESEGYDRKHLRIPDNHIALIESVAQVQPNVVVVLTNGAPVEMPWLNKVKGLLESYLAGQALGGAIADLLFGEASPSGKLAETFPKYLRDNPSYLNFPGEGDSVKYGEGIFVGYRYYDTKRIEPLFPFGYGLSYTEFEYSDLTISKKQMLDNETVEVGITVKNTGEVFGKEIVQLYVHDIESTVTRPEKELKGFEKIALHPNEEKHLLFTLNKRSFAYYNIDEKDWHVETGDFNILIGKSSKDIVLQETIKVESTSFLVKAVDRNTIFNDLLSNPKTAPIVQKVLDDTIQSRTKMDTSSQESKMFMTMLTLMPIRAMISFHPEFFNDEVLEEILNELNKELKEHNLLIN